MKSSGVQWDEHDAFLWNYCKLCVLIHQNIIDRFMDDIIVIICSSNLGAHIIPGTALPDFNLRVSSPIRSIKSLQVCFHKTFYICFICTLWNQFHCGKSPK